MYFIDVILPIPLKQRFTYSVNKDEAFFLRPGMRVAVPFGKSKVYTGIVYKVHSNDPPTYETKTIDQILDENPIITEIQLKHWEWMAAYYMCTLGEVVRAALPSAFLLESETIIKLIDDAKVEDVELTDDGFLIVEALRNQSSLHINDVRSILDRKNVVSVTQSLFEKGVITIEEEVYEQYTPKMKRYIKLAAPYTSEENLRELLDSMHRAPKQKEVLMTLFMLSSKERKPIESTLLQKQSNTTASVLKSLLDKHILEEFYEQQDRVQYSGEDTNPIKALSEAQKTAFKTIKETFTEKDITLLHGVTSSGKTEVYVKLISEILKQGKQVLYMLPEIALTTQLITRLQNYFGEQVSVYHSKYSVNERVEVWNNVLENKPKAQIVIGARSSLFLPFQKLGLLVVDEEHEPSFKQYNPSPRYHGRDAAIVLANLHQAKTLLGSATPSLETYYNAQHDKYGLVSLTERFGNVMMPEIELVDIKEKHKKKLMKGHFSDRLVESIQAALDNEEQVILFQNRRGFSPFVECKTCGTAPQCPNCDVSLTYHKHKGQLRCHYCGFNMQMMAACFACGNPTLDTKGFGTEQIETELKSLFPEHTVARMDQDTTRGKHAYAKIIEKLENREVDILVGTQMVAKGLDFRNVSLVGVMNADTLLNFPDFRAHERCFQLLQQVSGRAGRTKKRGTVLIQTFNPLHQILQQVSANAYEAMYKEQTEDRYQFKYPPFYRTIKITFRHRNYEVMQKASIWFARALQVQFKENILGPEPPPVGRVRNQFITNIMVKIPKQQSLGKTKRVIGKIQQTFDAIKDFSSVKLTIDVDNY
ncbi:replication restart helicase PriA [Rasiella sp. SM2506]|uniref:replication restart helicase PriA n=1 Tax=Rasiella sp. SM2506 TaxID=3423914 RepID=UPI003D798831